MKNLKFLFSVIMLLITMYACKKDGGSGGNAWSATINGKTQSGPGTFDYVDSTQTLTATLSQGTVILIANNGSATLTTGSYNLSGMSNSGGSYAGGPGLYLSNTGQININQFSLTSKTVSGTFNFVGYLLSLSALDSVIVTNGTFSGPVVIH